MSAQAPISPISAVRQLVVFGPSFPASQKLPSLDLPLPAEVKASAVGDDAKGAPDTIAIVESVAIALWFAPPGAVTGAPAGTVSPLPPTPMRQRTVEMFQYDGGAAFTPPTPVPIPIP